VVVVVVVVVVMVVVVVVVQKITIIKSLKTDAITHRENKYTCLLINIYTAPKN